MYHTPASQKKHNLAVHHSARAPLSDISNDLSRTKCRGGIYFMPNLYLA